MTVEVGAELLIDLHEKVNYCHDRLSKDSGEPNPIRKPVGGSIVLQTGFTTPALLTLSQSPSIGRCWNILKIGVFGTDTHTAVTSVTADVFAGDVTDSILNFQDCVLSGAAIPSVTNFGRKVEWCYAGQSIYALLYGSGLSAGQPYELVARVAEYNTYDVEARGIPR